MRRGWAFGLALMLVSAWSSPGFGQVPAGTIGRVDYASQVRPILTARCLSCHGPESSKSGLRVDHRASLLRGGDSGEPSIVAGDAAGSTLIRAVSGTDPDLKMPPKGGPLTPDQVAVLRAWIDQGAAMPNEANATPLASDPNHWSLLPLARVVPPRLATATAINDPVDAFIVDRLARSGLSLSPDADRRTWIRRLFLVVLGVPPTPEEVEAFVADGRDDAHERLVDRTLARPEFGERWAQHWLDVIRWAENWGYETNLERPNSWPYRDWLIRALNGDLPFDRFAFAQLAGDTIGDDAPTALLVAGPANLPGQIGKDEPSMRQARQDELDETVKTVGAAFLGLTIGCARCHDHKFDPISQADYYAFQAVFAGTHYGARRLRGAENDQWAQRANDVRRRVDHLRAQLDARRVALGLQPAVTPDRQIETFPPVLASAVRMSIRATSDGSRPSLFELEAWSAGSNSSNVALAAAGGKPSASSFALENQTRHPDNLVDGLLRTGDRFPWKARDPGPAWVEVELARPSTIDRLVWERGSEGFPVDYELAVRTSDGSWQTVAHSRKRMLHEADRRPADRVVLQGVTPSAVAGLIADLAALRQASDEYARLAAGPQVFAGTFGPAESSYRLYRGDPMQRRGTVGPEIPRVLGSLGLGEPTSESARRVALARWVVDRNNPLTSRVIVNRLWQHVFGTGLVDTPSDFGRMGSRPSHPELLDWLAATFVEESGSIKRLLRRLLVSRTFRQASAPRSDALAVDADCRLLWRFPPRRLEAEAIRDAILSVSGSLDTQRYGQGFDLFHQKGGLTDYIPRDSLDRASWRRMIYATKVRMKPVDIFGAFDCPDAGQMAPRRPRSITPIQALGLLNSAFLLRQSERFAARVRAEAGTSEPMQVERAFRLAFGRPPRPEETEPLVALARSFGLEQVGRVLLNANEFVFIP